MQLNVSLQKARPSSGAHEHGLALTSAPLTLAPSHRNMFLWTQPWCTAFSFCLKLFLSVFTVPRSLMKWHTCPGVHREIWLSLENTVHYSCAVPIGWVISICRCHLDNRGAWQKNPSGETLWDKELAWKVHSSK